MDRKKFIIIVAGIMIIMLVAIHILFLGDKDDFEGYRITQYGTTEDVQMMFYTIESSDGGFVIIDGGWKDNADAVRKVIKEHDNKVDAWILTHPHPDHIGAFNVILDDPLGIEIGCVYDNFVDYDYYSSVSNPWDEIEIYYEYLTLIIQGKVELRHINRGDVLDIIGLKVECFNAYDDIVVNATQSVCNSGSLMLRFEALEESFLICADVEEVMSSYLIENYKDRLQADYVQMSHHGNWGLSKDFYKLVSPKGAFFDGPASLYEKKELYNGWEYMQLMKDMGAKLYTFKTVPNSIIIR